jgi:hypothetical protein
MKKFIGIFLCLVLFSCERISAPSENQQIKQFHTETYPTFDTTFYVTNYTHINVGFVGIRLVDSSGSHINVSDSGTYSTRITQLPAYCIINGQVLTYGDPKWIIINDHTAVHAEWTTNVVVIDTGEQN